MVLTHAVLLTTLDSSPSKQLVVDGQDLYMHYSSVKLRNCSFSEQLGKKVYMTYVSSESVMLP